MSVNGSVISTQDHAVRRLQQPHQRSPRLFRLGAGWAVFAMVVFVAYELAVRPWHLRWGATSEEVTMPLPGDELVLNAADMRTRAITIRAPVSEVFPWLLQLGWERGGLYSYDWLENLMGLGFVNADRIHPEWQNMQAGDLVSMGSPGKSPIPYTVAQVIPNRAVILGHRADDGKRWADSWQFIVNPIDAHSTRLLLRARAHWDDALLGTIMTAIEPGVFIMERGMLLGIKERAEKVK